MGSDHQQHALQEVRRNVQDHAMGQEDWVTNHTLKRYLIARKWDVAKATKLLTGTLEWRRSFGVDSLTTEKVKANGVKGKLFVMGADRTGRPTLFMRPAQETTKDDHDNNLNHLVYNLERACSYMDEDAGIGKMICVLDCDQYSFSDAECPAPCLISSGCSSSNLTCRVPFTLSDTSCCSASNSPPMRTSTSTLHILQDHYPERLGKFLILNAPWYFSMFFKAISPFIDKNTKEKIEFISAKTPQEMKAHLSRHFDMSRFPEFLYGDLPAAEAFNPDEYYTLAGEERGKRFIVELRGSVSKI